MKEMPASPWDCRELDWSNSFYGPTAFLLFLWCLPISIYYRALHSLRREDIIFYRRVGWLWVYEVIPGTTLDDVFVKANISTIAQGAIILIRHDHRDFPNVIGQAMRRCWYWFHFGPLFILLGLSNILMDWFLQRHMRSKTTEDMVLSGFDWWEFYPDVPARCFCGSSECRNVLTLREFEAKQRPDYDDAEPTAPSSGEWPGPIPDEAQMKMEIHMRGTMADEILMGIMGLRALLDQQINIIHACKAEFDYDKLPALHGMVEYITFYIRIIYAKWSECEGPEPPKMEPVPIDVSELSPYDGYVEILSHLQERITALFMLHFLHENETSKSWRDFYGGLSLIIYDFQEMGANHCESFITAEMPGGEA